MKRTTFTFDDPLHSELKPVPVRHIWVVTCGKCKKQLRNTEAVPKNDFDANEVVYYCKNCGGGL